MNSLLFTELSHAEQESLSGGNYYYFKKDNWDCYKYYNEKWGGDYYQCYREDRRGQESGGTFID